MIFCALWHQSFILVIFYSLLYVFKLRYEDLKFLIKIRSINESKKTSKSNISTSESLRKVTVRF